MAPTQNDSILIIGATNCPHTLDEAIRRRFVKRMYIPLPSTETRAEFTKHALQDSRHNLSADDFNRVAESTRGFSCADMHALCTEAALCPVRAISDIRNVRAEDIRPIQHQDFTQALGTVKASVEPSTEAL
ncbi:P-loop containing nucleoside triphosphate hydrolase [Phytophthora cactorum]|nr:P-loop containing nucleoside triphosphate hydrolase [Phytophthora cactorum]